MMYLQSTPSVSGVKRPRITSVQSLTTGTLKRLNPLVGTKPKKILTLISQLVFIVTGKITGKVLVSGLKAQHLLAYIF